MQTNLPHTTIKVLILLNFEESTLKNRHIATIYFGYGANIRTHPRPNQEWCPRSALAAYSLWGCVLNIRRCWLLRPLHPWLRLSDRFEIWKAVRQYTRPFEKTNRIESYIIMTSHNTMIRCLPDQMNQALNLTSVCRLVDIFESQTI